MHACTYPGTHRTQSGRLKRGKTKRSCASFSLRDINIVFYRSLSSSAHPDSNYAIFLILVFIYPVIKITLSVMPNYVARRISSMPKNPGDVGPEEVIRLNEGKKRKK